MKIKRLTYRDLGSHWEVQNISFKDLTLLVGASGVGKTQILQCILRLRAITRGESISGIRWHVVCESDGHEYVWEGEYSQTSQSILRLKSSIEEDDESDPAIISFEKISIDGKLVIDRNDKEIFFNGVKTVKLPQDKSITNLLKEESDLEGLHAGFSKVIYSDQVGSIRRPQRLNPDLMKSEILLQKYNTINEIRESSESFVTKLMLTYNNAPKVMRQIKERYIDIFPFVSDIRVAPLEEKNSEGAPSFLRDIPFIQIKEKNVEDWVVQPTMSSGMFRSLLHLCEIFLSADGSLILIDEFENSLGVNCIDELAFDLRSSKKRGLQFIITSHHPYIINHIHYDNWKLVTRKGSHVTGRDAVDLVDFGSSKQEAFIQLTQLEEFTSGIEV